MTTTTAKSNLSPLAQLLKSDANLITTLKIGDLVEGTFIERGTKKAFFDLNHFGTGIVYGVEYLNAQDVLKTLTPGVKVLAKVLDSESDAGYVELSLTEADKQKSWQVIKELHEAGEIIPVTIVGANAGGLIAVLQEQKAFLPVSQLAADHYPKVDDSNRVRIAEELKKFIGQELNIKILDVNPRTGKLIISEREIASANTRELLAKYTVGDIIDGIISGITDFGAFIKFANDPDLEGLIHISELDHRLIENPKELVKIGDVLKVKIIEIKDGRVSLSLKALKSNPWDQAGEKYQASQLVTGTVTRFNPFGAFVALDENLQGLIHVSQFGGIEAMKQQLVLGGQHSFIIDLVRPQEKRIILKLA